MENLSKKEFDFLVGILKNYIDGKIAGIVNPGQIVQSYFEENYMKTYTGGMPLDQSTFRTFLRVCKFSKGIVSITKTSTSGLVDTYTITYTDNTTTTFQVTNGKDAEIDDTTTSTTKVWSSSKVSTELAVKATKSALNKLKPLIYAGL